MSDDRKIPLPVPSPLSLDDLRLIAEALGWNEMSRQARKRALDTSGCKRNYTYSMPGEECWDDFVRLSKLGYMAMYPTMSRTSLAPSFVIQATQKGLDTLKTFYTPNS